MKTVTEIVIAALWVMFSGCTQSSGEELAMPVHDKEILVRFEKNLRVYLGGHVIRYDGGSLNQMLLNELTGEWTPLPTGRNDSKRQYGRNRWTVIVYGDEVEAHFFIATDFDHGDSTELVLILRDGPKPEVLKESIEALHGA